MKPEHEFKLIFSDNQHVQAVCRCGWRGAALRPEEHDGNLLAWLTPWFSHVREDLDD